MEYSRVLKCESTCKRFHPGECSNRGLLHDCENRWIVCSFARNHRHHRTATNKAAHSGLQQLIIWRSLRTFSSSALVFMLIGPLNPSSNTKKRTKNDQNCSSIIYTSKVDLACSMQLGGAAVDTNNVLIKSVTQSSAVQSSVWTCTA